MEELTPEGKGKKVNLVLKVIVFSLIKNHRIMGMPQIDGKWGQMRCLNMGTPSAFGYIGYNPALPKKKWIELSDADTAFRVKWVVINGDLFLQRDDNLFLDVNKDVQLACWTTAGCAILYNDDTSISLKSNPDQKLCIDPGLPANNDFFYFFSVGPEGADESQAFKCFLE
ncbi:hypothetical protein [Taibaiella soli]|uniref:Uncharacterized protein n=1 Tax=Taibaiella soli TaxID=1649169 RepID=A0A2W2A8P8_9BACT|nr:hypothetical protein [Taibaiella soli]PZF71685.1 hypothetical protein DN068_16585 [Taibaiella soli]